jgi:hypothetical protein
MPCAEFPLVLFAHDGAEIRVQSAPPSVDISPTPLLLPYMPTHPTCYTPPTLSWV